MAKLTKDEIEERFEYAAFLMARRLPKSQMKRILKETYEVKSARQVERYLAGARAIARKSSRIKPDEALRQAIDFYNSVIQDPEAEMGDKIKAQERLDKLYGHESHYAHTVKMVGDKNNPVQIQSVSIDPLAFIERARTLVRDAEEKRRVAITGGTQQRGEGTGRNQGEDSGVQVVREESRTQVVETSGT